MKRIGECTREEAKAEGDAFLLAIMDAIDGVARERDQVGKVVHLPCVMGALVSALAHHLGGIDDEERRLHAYGEIGQQLADMAIVANVSGMHAQVIDNTGPVQ
jgi:hypothetical protein